MRNRKLNVFVSGVTTLTLVSFLMPASVIIASPKEGRIKEANNSSYASYKADELVVKFKRDSKPFRKIRLPRGSNVAEAVAAYKSNPNIVYAEPNYIAQAYFVPNDPYYGLQWHFDNIVNGGVHAEAAWDTSRGSGAVVAVVDTGIAYETYKPSKKERYYQAPDLSGTCFVQGYDFVNNDTHANDDDSHGTHVAGTIAQSTNNGKGVAGLAHEACLMPVKVLDRNGSGSYADVADGIRFAADNGADVINLSLGGPVPGQVIEDAVAYAYGKGVTVVAAAGNENGAVGYPAAYDAYVIAVGATRYDEARASYSNFGPSVDIVAPGGDLGLDQNGDGYGDGVLQNTFNPNTKRRNDFGYWFFDGTSMATPHVAAVAALLISNGNAITPDDIRAALETTADDLGTAGRDDFYGWGLLDAEEALTWASGPVDNPPSVTVTSPADNATVDGVISITADANDDNGIIQVEFYADAVLIGADSTSPYETIWDSTTVVDGAHMLTATAIDTVSQTASHSISVAVDNVNDPPVADAGPDQSAFIGSVVNFDGSGSFDSDGSIVSYDWDFGDGVTVGGVTTNHAYSAVGIYTVTLTVTDNVGLTDQDAALVTVSEVAADVVNITKATYDARKAKLQVEATSSQGGIAVLTVEGFGTMEYNGGKNIYKLRVQGVANPGTVTVTSSLGGSDTSVVTAKNAR